MASFYADKFEGRQTYTDEISQPGKADGCEQYAPHAYLGPGDQPAE